MLRPFINLLLYSNLWIALCAAAMCWYTQLVLTGRYYLGPLAAFIFFATLLLYALHRLVGLSRAEGFKGRGRYFVIERFRSHITFYALLSALATAWFAWQLPWRAWWWLLPAGVVSLGYVLPVFTGGRRLRDFPYIKIFLIALAWTWITVWLPAVERGLFYNLPLLLLLAERFFFIFAITLPFDIRDLEIDRANGVKTIPAAIGLSATRRLALAALAVSILFAIGNHYLDAYSPGALVGVISSLLITGLAIVFTTPQRHDYYFSGLLDGMMVLQFLGLWLGMRL